MYVQAKAKAKAEALNKAQGPSFSAMSFLQRASSRMYSFDFSNDISDSKQFRVVEVHSTNQWRSYFDASKRNNKLLVIQFTATWCKPCRFIDPVIKEFAAKFTDVDFIKIDVDELMLVANQFEATTLPAFVLIKEGKQVAKVLGAKKIDLQNKIEQHRI